MRNYNALRACILFLLLSEIGCLSPAAATADPDASGVDTNAQKQLRVGVLQKLNQIHKIQNQTNETKKRKTHREGESEEEEKTY